MSETEHAERQPVPTFDVGSEALEGLTDAGRELLPLSDNAPAGPTMDDQQEQPVIVR